MMKKNFPLHAAGKAPARVLDDLKHEVNKYVRREKKKTLPEGFDWWEFDSRVGAEAGSATAVALDDINRAIDAVAKTEATSVYVEILARAGLRPRRESAQVIGTRPVQGIAPIAPGGDETGSPD